MFKKIVSAGLVLFFVVAGLARAELLWAENFVTVDRWSVSSDPSGSASVAPDPVYDLGVFGVLSPSSSGTFDSSDRTAFDPSNPSAYTITISVSNFTGTTAPYSVDIAQYDDTDTYLQSTTIFTETQSLGWWEVNLGGFSFHPDTDQVSARVVVDTEDEASSISFDKLAMDGTVAVPEPASAMLVGVGLLLLARLKLRGRR
jgi:hypothetical protein